MHNRNNLAIGLGAAAPHLMLAPEPAGVNLLVVDPNPMMRAGLRAALASEVSFRMAGEASGGYAAALACRQLDIDIAIIDVHLGDLDIYEAVIAMRNARPALKILLLYVSLSSFEIGQVLQAGVTGLLPRNAAPETLAQAVRTIANGGSYVPATLMSRIFRDAPIKSGLNTSGLSEREIEVLRFVASGFSNKDIARRLNLSVRTVETHRFNLRRKTQLSRPKDLAQLAKRFDLLAVEPDPRQPNSLQGAGR